MTYKYQTKPLWRIENKVRVSAPVAKQSLKLRQKPKEAPVDDFLQTCQSFSVGRENEPPDVHRGPLVVRLLHDQDVERLAELSAAVLINKKQGAGVRLLSLL